MNIIKKIKNKYRIYKLEKQIKKIYDDERRYICRNIYQVIFYKDKDGYDKLNQYVLECESDINILYNEIFVLQDEIKERS